MVATDQASWLFVPVILNAVGDLSAEARESWALFEVRLEATELNEGHTNRMAKTSEEVLAHGIHDGSNMTVASNAALQAAGTA